MAAGQRSRLHERQDVDLLGDVLVAAASDDGELEDGRGGGVRLSGRLLPPALRSPYIIDVYYRALRSYVPQEYPGRVTIFKSDQTIYRPPMHWMELITGQ